MKIFIFILTIVVLSSCSQKTLYENYYVKMTESDIKLGEVISLPLSLNHDDSTFYMTYWNGNIDTVYGKYVLKRNKLILLPKLISVVQKEDVFRQDTVKIVFYRKILGHPSYQGMYSIPLPNYYFMLNGIYYKSDSTGAILYPIEKERSKNTNINIELSGFINTFPIYNSRNIQYIVTIEKLLSIVPDAFQIRIKGGKRIKTKLGKVMYAEVQHTNE